MWVSKLVMEKVMKLVKDKVIIVKIAKSKFSSTARDVTDCS